MSSPTSQATDKPLAPRAARKHLAAAEAPWTPQDVSAAKLLVALSEVEPTWRYWLVADMIAATLFLLVPPPYSTAVVVVYTAAYIISSFKYRHLVSEFQQARYRNAGNYDVAENVRRHGPLLFAIVMVFKIVVAALLVGVSLLGAMSLVGAVLHFGVAGVLMWVTTGRLFAVPRGLKTAKKVLEEVSAEPWYETWKLVNEPLLLAVD